MKRKRNIFSRFTAVFLALMILLSMFPVISVDAAGQTSITLKQGDEFPYTSGWGRTMVEMTADGKQIYCVQPDKSAPPNGTYRTDKGNLKEIPTSDSKYQMYNKALYYCYGGGGFNKENNAFKTDTSKHMQKYSGNTPSAFMGNLKYSQYGYEFTTLSGSRLHSMISHLLMSYIYYGESKYKSATELLIPENGYCNDNCTMIKDLYNAVSKAPNPPVSAKLYMLNIGDKYQKVIVYRETVKLQLQKSSSISSISYSLEGAKYNVYLDKNCTDYFGYITTDSTGYGKYGAGATGADVPVQSYYCREAEAPTGYELDKTVYEFKKTSTTVSGSAVYKATVTDKPLVHLQLLKSSANPDITNDNDCYSLEGAVYGIYKDSACENIAGQIVTDKDGYGAYVNSSGNSGTNTATADKGSVAYGKESGTAFAYPSGLENNTYYCKEITAPPGYDLDDTVYTFKDSGSISSDGVKIYRAYSDNDIQPVDNPVNDPVGIVLQKKHAITGETTNQGLEGAIFEVQYYAQEIDKDYDVDTSKGETAPTLDTAKLKRTWYIKTNSNGRTRLGSEYLVNDNTYTSGELYYDSGIVTVPIGTVVIKEVKEPDGYTKSPVVFYRRITEEGANNAQATGTPLEVPIDEMPSNGYIGIHKMNQSGQGVGGAVYGLYDDENTKTLLSTLTTDNGGRGVFNFEAKVNKTYYIKEITAPTGYALDTTVYPITPTDENSTADTAVIQDIYEDSIKGDIVIKKSANDGVVSNLYFALSDNLGNEYNAVATDSTGTAKFTGLPVYDSSNNKIKYTVKELGFKTTPGAKSYGGFTWTVKAENCIQYKGAYYEGVANNTFSDCEYAYSRYYYGNKTEAINNSNGYTKTLTANSEVTFNFNNTVKTTDIEVNKSSYDGKVYDFYFKVVDQNGKQYGEIKTNSEGIAKYSEKYSKPLLSCITVPNSAIALRIKYRVEELGLRTPGGTGSYYFPDNYLGLVVSDYKSDNLSTSESIVFDAYNKADTGRLEINKSSDDGYLSGIWFKVTAYINYADIDEEPDLELTHIGYDNSGNEINEFYLQTDSNGKTSTDSLVFYDYNGYVMSGLPVYAYNMNGYEIVYRITELGLKASDGTYYIPDRYVTNDDVSFNLLDNRSYTYNCHNSVKTGKLQIQKTSEDNIVEDMWFSIESSLGYKANFVTDSTGYTDVIDNLPIYVPATSTNELVTYKITELGYLQSDGSYEIPFRYKTPRSVTVKLNTDSTVTFARINNTLKQGSVTLYKQDSDGNALTGSQWELYNSSDDSLVSLVQTGNGQYQYNDKGKIVVLNTNNGKIIVSNLKQGDYYFSEKTPPDGKMTYGKKIEFTISADSEETLNLSLTAVDHNIVMYDTGSNGTVIIYTFGFILLAFSFAIILFYKNYNKKESLK